MAAAGYHTESQQAAPASYLPRHSPILNLSPNLSPESQPDSSGSPVFELLDSNRRRTVQGRHQSTYDIQCTRVLPLNWN